jgi:hypothetical protein
VQDVAGPAGLVADAELAVARQAVEEPLELRQVVRESLEARRILGRRWQDGNGDGVLVDVHAEVDDRGGSSGR